MHATQSATHRGPTGPTKSSFHGSLAHRFRRHNERVGWYCNQCPEPPDQKCDECNADDDRDGLFDLEEGS